MRRGQDGATAVEFALVLPVVLALLGAGLLLGVRSIYGGVAEVAARAALRSAELPMSRGTYPSEDQLCATAAASVPSVLTPPVGTCSAPAADGASFRVAVCPGDCAAIPPGECPVVTNPAALSGDAMDAGGRPQAGGRRAAAAGLLQTPAPIIVVPSPSASAGSGTGSGGGAGTAPTPAASASASGAAGAGGSLPLPVTVPSTLPSTVPTAVTVPNPLSGSPTTVAVPTVSPPALPVPLPTLPAAPLPTLPATPLPTQGPSTPCSLAQGGAVIVNVTWKIPFLAGLTFGLLPTQSLATVSATAAGRRE